MGIKLSEANKFLKNKRVRDWSIEVSVATSSAIEGIRQPFKATGKAGTPVKKHRSPNGRRSNPGQG